MTDSPEASGSLSLLRTLITALYKLTVLGVVVHEFAHKITVQMCGYQVHDVDYYSHVDHEMPRKFAHALFIGYAPLFINTGLALAILYARFQQLPLTLTAIPTPRYITSPVYATALSLFTLFVALSLVFNAVPSVADIRNVFLLARHRISIFRPTSIIGSILILPLTLPLFVGLWLASRLGLRYLVDSAFTLLVALSVFGFIHWAAIFDAVTRQLATLLPALGEWLLRLAGLSI